MSCCAGSPRGLSGKAPSLLPLRPQPLTPLFPLPFPAQNPPPAMACHASATEGAGTARAFVSVPLQQSTGFQRYTGGTPLRC